MTHTHTAEVIWSRGDQAFLDKRYSRKHTVKFDGGIEVPASSSPHVVPLPYSEVHAIDPEEALVAAIASCHMLSFLFVAVQKRFVVDSYRDNAVGVMTLNERNKCWISSVTLQPKIIFSGERQPSTEEIAHMHHLAHEECYIANSVKTDIQVRSE